MKFDKHLPLTSMLAVLLIGSSLACSSVAAQANQNANKASYQSVVDASLKKGMAAADVIQVLGKPSDVKVMATQTGKAEVWSYVRRISDVPTQVQVGSTPVTTTSIGSDGMAHTQVISETPIYKMAHQIKEETLALLMFNDHFAEKKITVSERRQYD